MKTLILAIGLFHFIFAILGMMDLLHYRLYIGTEDMVHVPRAELERLKKVDVLYQEKQGDQHGASTVSREDQSDSGQGGNEVGNQGEKTNA